MDYTVIVTKADGQVLSKHCATETDVVNTIVDSMRGQFNSGTNASHVDFKVLDNTK